MNESSSGTAPSYKGPTAWPELTGPDGVTFSPPRETFMLAYRGSIAHGMFIPSSDPNSIDDIDLMGFVFGTKENYFGLREWGSRGTKEIKHWAYDVVLYEIRKAVSLLLQGNPNILSMLWTNGQHVLLDSPASKELVANRHLFIGKHVYHAFAGYAHQQLEKMETRDPAELREYLAVTAELKYRGKHPNKISGPDPLGEREEGGNNPTRDLGPSEGINPKSSREVYNPLATVISGESRDARNWSDEKLLARMSHFQRKGENLGYMGDKRKQLVLEHGFDSKNAAHLIRLLRMCVEFMRTGELTVLRPDAAELLDIKRGKWKLEDVKSLSTSLFEEAKAARDNSKLPSDPDRESVEKLLVKLVREEIYK